MWKDRSNASARTVVGIFLLLAVAGLGADHDRHPQVKVVPSFVLKDQFLLEHRYSFPRTNMSVLVVADHEGSKLLEGWIAPLQREFRDRIRIDGLADVSAVPGWLRRRVRRAFSEKVSYPVLLDWQGAVVKWFPYAKGQPSIFVIDQNGRIAAHSSGKASQEKLETLRVVLRGEVARPDG